MSAADVRKAAEAVRARSASRHLLLFSDFDGTLCEFRADPESVLLTDARRALLDSIGARGTATIAIVSGRRLEDVRQRCLLSVPAYYAGVHGLEIAGPGTRFRHPDVEGRAALIRQLVRSLAAAVAGLPGVFVEDKELSLVAHFRDASAADAARAAAIVETLARRHVASGDLRAMQGDCMLELLPDVPWDKGSAVEWILERVSHAHEDPWPLYIGDDVTDQDGFRVVSGRGLSIASSTRAAGAELSLEGPHEVEELLRALSDAESG